MGFSGASRSSAVARLWFDAMSVPAMDRLAYPQDQSRRNGRPRDASRSVTSPATSGAISTRFGRRRPLAPHTTVTTRPVAPVGHPGPHPGLAILVLASAVMVRPGRGLVGVGVVLLHGVPVVRRVDPGEVLEVGHGRPGRAVGPKSSSTIRSRSSALRAASLVPVDRSSMMRSTRDLDGCAPATTFGLDGFGVGAGAAAAALAGVGAAGLGGIALLLT